MLRTRLLWILLAIPFLPHLAIGATVHAPMIDQFDDPTILNGSPEDPNVDQWTMIADDSGTIEVQLFLSADSPSTVFSIDGGSAVSGIPDDFATITVMGVAPGSEHVLSVTKETLGGIVHYRPRFSGVDQVFVTEDVLSPNDLVNGPDAVFTGICQPGDFVCSLGSNIELGFDARFDTLPSTFADTTWFYLLDVGDTISWNGFFDDFPGGQDAVLIELFDANMVLQDSASMLPLLDSMTGVSFNDTVEAGQEGFWAVKITAPEVFTTFAGHYLMDVEVTSTVNAAEKSERHYLLPGSLLAPPVPEPTAASLLGLGLIAFGIARRRA